VAGRAGTGPCGRGTALPWGRDLSPGAGSCPGPAAGSGAAWPCAHPHTGVKTPRPAPHPDQTSSPEAVRASVREITSPPLLLSLPHGEAGLGQCPLCGGQAAGTAAASPPGLQWAGRRTGPDPEDTHPQPRTPTPRGSKGPGSSLGRAFEQRGRARGREGPVLHTAAGQHNQTAPGAWVSPRWFNLPEL